MARSTKKRTAKRAGSKKRTTRKTSRTRTTRKPASRKKTTRTATRRTTTKATPRPTRITAADGPRTKSEIYGILAEHAGITKKEVATVFETLGEIISKDLSKRGPGVVNVAGMMKILVQRKPAVPRRRGVNPFTGEEQWFKAKPARNVVKIRPLKALKDRV